MDALLLGAPCSGSRVTFNYPGMFLSIELKEKIDLDILNMFIATAERKRSERTFKRVKP